MSTEAIIFTGVGIYLVLMIAIGLFASKRSGSADDFIVAGRRMPVSICSVTLAATWFGAGPMMGSAGASYEKGLIGVIADPFGTTVVLFAVGFFFVRLFRRLGLLTFVELFTTRFGPTAATIAATGAIISAVGWTSAMLVAFGLVFNSMTGIGLETGIIAGAIVVFVYTAVGGMWAVALTDFIQMAIIAVGLVLLLVAVLIDVGGWSAISAQLPEHTFRMIPLEHTPGRWLDYIRLWLIFGLADVTSQSLLQRAAAAKDEQAAQNSFYLAGVGYLVLAMIPVMLGIIASVTMPGLAQPEQVIPTLALNHLHPVLIAVFVGALLAAIMSTTDSVLLAAASVLSTNILPLFKPDPPDHLRLSVTRLAIPAFGTCAVLLALYAQAVLDLMVETNAVMLACVAAPFIAGIWWRRANRIGVLCAMAIGFLTWRVAAISGPDLPGDLLGFVACVVTLLVVTPLTQRVDPPRAARTRSGEEVELKDRLGVLPLFRRVEEKTG